MKLGELPLFPEQASAAAGSVDVVFLAVAAVCTVLAVGILCAIVFLLTRYRAGNPRPDRSDPPRSLLRLELTWIIVPTLLGLVLFAVGARTYYQLYTMPRQADLELHVIGKQWMWRIQYPTGYRTINRVVVPRGKTTLLKMISEDVIHSFFLPEFRLKHDVLPGRYTTIWLEPDRVGVYHLFCAEYCGTDHSRMRGRIEVMEPEAFDAWLNAKSGLRLSSVLRGKALFERFGCAQCHSENRAPRLPGAWGNSVTLTDGRTVVVDDDYVRESILYPARQVVAGFEPTIMPSYEGRLTEQDILDLTAFLREGTSE